jgi:hypothetical protein
MRIGRNNSIAGTLGLILAATLLAASPIWAMERYSGIWKVLRAGHFSGPINEGAHVQPIKGSIVARDKRYRLWKYSWLNKRQAMAEMRCWYLSRPVAGFLILGLMSMKGTISRGRCIL